jgi:hypothetical protein
VPPAPATAIAQEILDDLVTALGAITAGAEYTYTVDPAHILTRRVNLMLYPTAPVIVIGPAVEGGRRQFLPAMRVREWLIFVLEARIDVPGPDDGRLTEAYHAFVQDIETALTQDLRRGGFATQTRLRAPVGPYTAEGLTSSVLFTQEIEIETVRPYGG